jgi:beta-1,4-mannosyl-glycoprotein beta-1,4-N-acetylglucosaminyltransferase
MKPSLKFALKQKWHRWVLPVAGVLGKWDRPARRVYELLLFNRELELLETRLNYLDPVVDVFVLGESEQTFIGEAKPLWFAQNRARFQKFEKKIRHVVIPPPGSADYEVSGNDPNLKTTETYHRRMLRAGLTEARSRDVVLYSDADEIPSRQSVYRLIGLLRLGYPVAICQMDWHLLYLNAVAVGYAGAAAGRPCEWFGTAGTTMANFQHLYAADANRLWQFRWGEMSKCLFRIAPGGWHLSYLGGLERLAQKHRDNACRVRDPAENAALRRHEIAQVRFEFRDLAGLFPAELQAHLGPLLPLAGSEQQFARELAQYEAGDI